MIVLVGHHLWGSLRVDGTGFGRELDTKTVMHAVAEDRRTDCACLVGHVLTG